MPEQQKVRSRVIATHTITCEGSTTLKLVRSGRYNWQDPAITDERFPIQTHASSLRTIELIECDYELSSEEALEELRRHGLERPTHEDALQFGVDHPEEQRKRRIVFLHEPVRGPRARFFILVLFEDAGHRRLGLGKFGDVWGRSYVFAGVRANR